MSKCQADVRRRPSCREPESWISTCSITKSTIRLAMAAFVEIMMHEPLPTPRRLVVNLSAASWTPRIEHQVRFSPYRRSRRASSDPGPKAADLENSRRQFPRITKVMPKHLGQCPICKECKGHKVRYLCLRVREKTGNPHAVHRVRPDPVGIETWQLLERALCVQFRIPSNLRCLPRR